jgi:SPP1 gp7 family putative phage head morphogenesis protein
MPNKNNFPLHIEKQQEQVYVNAIKRLSRMVLPEIRKQFKKQKTEEKKIITLDADNFGDLENQLEEEFKKQLLKSGFIAAEIEKVAFLLDAWTVAKTKQSIKRIQKIKRRTAKSKIPIIFQPDDPIVLDFLDTYIKQNIDLVTALGKEFIPDVTDLASQTFISGGSTKDLAANLKQFTEGNEKRAAFWARDQVGTAYSQLTKTRQESAGFTHYIWRTVGDSHVRGNDPADQTSHVVLDGEKFSWSKGASDTGQLSAPGAKHPGEDYNCRCTAEPDFE